MKRILISNRNNVRVNLYTLKLNLYLFHITGVIAVNQRIILSPQESEDVFKELMNPENMITFARNENGAKEDEKQFPKHFFRLCDN